MSKVVLIAIFLLSNNSEPPLNRFNTICNHALQGLLNQSPHSRAEFMRKWIVENAMTQQTIRLWYRDKKENRWRRHIFAPRDLRILVEVKSDRPEIILRQNGAEYHLSDFYFRNEIELTAEEQSAHLKDIRRLIRSSYHYPEDAVASPGEPSGTERVAWRFLQLDPSLVREMIETDPQKADGVLKEMQSELRRIFDIEPTHSVALDFGLRSPKNQRDLRTQVIQKLGELFQATHDERLNPERVFKTPDPSFDTLAGVDAVSVYLPAPNPIYRYRGDTGIRSLPRSPDVLEAGLRKRILLLHISSDLLPLSDKAAMRERYEWTLVQDSRTFEDLKKLKERDADAFSKLASWIQINIRERMVDENSLPTQDFVERLQLLSKRLETDAFLPEHIFPELYPEGRLNVKLQLGRAERNAKDVFEGFQRRLLLIGVNTEVGFADYREAFRQERTLTDLMFLRSQADPKYYEAAIEFLRRHIPKNLRDEHGYGVQLRHWLAHLSSSLNEPRLKIENLAQ